MLFVIEEYNLYTVVYLYWHKKYAYGVKKKKKSKIWIENTWNL